MLECVALFLFGMTIANAAINFGNLNTSWSGIDASQFQTAKALRSDFLLYWKMDSSNITFGLSCQCDGWVGFGISRNGGMKGADMAILSKPSGSDWVLNDYHSEDFVTPQLDSSQDLHLLSVSVSGGVKSFTWTRRIESCDTTDDLDVGDLANWVIFAKGMSGQNNLIQHSSANRGIMAINFRDQNQLTNSTLPVGTLTFDVVASPYTITSADTQYVCSSHVLPQDKPYHVIGVRPLINSTLAHHIILYQCSTNPNLNGPSICGPMRENCTAFWTGWAKGGLDLWYPQEAGLPMGQGQFGAKYLIMEVHYDNPDHLSGMNDTSGMELVYTDVLRQYDLGTLVVGTWLDEIDIPPFTESQTYVNYCPSTCTSKLPHPITVISNLFHMHHHGTSAYTQIIRDGVELEPLGTMPNYDFNFQNSQPIQRTIMPGDTLIHHCSFSTKNTSYSVYGGESSMQEMCFNFMVYYPVTPIKLCIDVSWLSAGYAACLNTLSFVQITQNYSAQFVQMQQVPAYKPYQTESRCQNEALANVSSEAADVALIGGLVGFFAAFIVVLMVGVCVIVFLKRRKQNQKQLAFEKTEKQESEMTSTSTTNSKNGKKKNELALEDGAISATEKQQLKEMAANVSASDVSKQNTDSNKTVQALLYTNPNEEKEKEQQEQQPNAAPGANPEKAEQRRTVTLSQLHQSLKATKSQTDVNNKSRVVALHKDFVPNDQDLATLVDMGFSTENATTALKLTYGDLDKAITWCTEHK